MSLNLLVNLPLTVWRPSILLIFLSIIIAVNATDPPQIDFPSDWRREKSTRADVDFGPE